MHIEHKSDEPEANESNLKVNDSVAFLDEVVNSSSLESEEISNILRRQLASQYNPFNQLINKFGAIMINLHNDLYYHRKAGKVFLAEQDIQTLSSRAFKKTEEYSTKLTNILASIVKFITCLLSCFSRYYIGYIESEKLQEIKEILSKDCLLEVLYTEFYKVLRNSYRNEYDKQDELIHIRINELRANPVNIIKSPYHKLLDDTHPIAYPESIQLMKKFTLSKNFKDKYFIIKPLKSKIENEVEKFWTNKQISQIKIAINSDILIEILQYLIVVTDCQFLFSDTALLCDCFSRIAKGEESYILTTFQASLQNMIDPNIKIPVDEELKNKSVIELTIEDHFDFTDDR